MRRSVRRFVAWVNAMPPRPLELIRALCDALDEMTRQVAWLEHRGARLEAAALRVDIKEAQTHIKRLQRRYLGGDRRAPARANSLNRFAETGRPGLPGRNSQGGAERRGLHPRWSRVLDTTIEPRSSSKPAVRQTQSGEQPC